MEISPATVKRGVEAFVQRTGADELIVTAQVFDHKARVRSFEILAEVHRELYDYMLALGGPLKEGNAEEYLKLASKKFGKLKRATDLFERLSGV